MIIVMLIFSANLAWASLSERVQIEESVKNRVQSLIKIYDENSKVIISFKYRNYKETLPGTYLDESQGIVPNSIEASDIQNISIEVYSDQLEKYSSEVQNKLGQILPINKSRVRFKINPLINKVSEKSAFGLTELESFVDSQMNQISKFTLALFCGFFILSAALLVWYGRSRSKATAQDLAQGLEQMSRVVGPNLHSESLPSSAPARFDVPLTQQNEFSDWAVDSLSELISDCYWSEKDGYAHAIWMQLSNSQQTQLLKSGGSFLKSYITYFVQAKPVMENSHQHPYYLSPNPLLHLSNQDLEKIVNKNIKVWSMISPIRQKSMNMRLEQKIEILSMSNEPISINWQNYQASQRRQINQNAYLFYLTFEEEDVVFNNLNLVPAAARESIHSLVWLAHCQDADISIILDQFDARSLAMAWVGHPQVLSKLLTCMPDKKQKLLLTYLEKVSSSRDNEIYKKLVQFGVQSLNKKIESPQLKNVA